MLVQNWGRPWSHGDGLYLGQMPCFLLRRTKESLCGQVLSNRVTCLGPVGLRVKNRRVHILAFPDPRSALVDTVPFACNPTHKLFPVLCSILHNIPRPMV